MQPETLPVLSLADDPARFSLDIGNSFRTFGFAMVTDHGIDLSLIDRAWQLTEAFFAQETAEKMRYAIPGISGARGYTPFGTEIAKGAKLHDLKEFWHVGRDVPEDSPLRSSMPPKSYRRRRPSTEPLARRPPPGSMPRAVMVRLCGARGMWRCRGRAA